MEEVINWLEMAKESYVDVYLGFLRYAAPILAFILLWRCLKPLLFFKREPEIWAWLNMADGTKHALTHWENVIGRSKSSDVRIDFSTVSRNHAVLTRYDDGSWTVTDANSKSGVLVNGQRVQICALEEDDVINIGGLDMTLVPITKRQESMQAQLRTKGASGFDSVANLLTAAAARPAAWRVRGHFFVPMRKYSTRTNTRLPAAMPGTICTSLGPMPSRKAQKGESRATVIPLQRPAARTAIARTALTQEPVIY